MSRSSFAVALAMVLVAMCATRSSAENTIRTTTSSEWLHAKDMPALVSSLEDWLDAQADWPRREAPPLIRTVSQWQAEARQGATATFQRGSLRGLYDPDQSEILLIRPWDPRDPEDVSVLLHELVHHRQAPHHWYCPAAQELSAYQLQDAWLADQGVAIEVNWIAVMLDAGCTPRDIHPQ